MANAADIIVNLVAKTGRLESGMRRGGKSVSNFQKRAQQMRRTVVRASAALATFGAVAFGGLIALTKQAITLNDELGKFATRLGISTDELKILQIAADLSGQKVNALTVGLQRMVRRVNEAAVGTGEAKQAIIDLGLNAVDLAKLKPDEIFRAIAERMDLVATQGQRIQLAFKLLDTEGVGLVNTMKLLNSEGFAAIEKSGRDMNAVLADFQVAQFEAGQDAVTLMGIAFEGVKNTIALEMLPAVFLLKSRIIDIATEAGTNTTEFRAWTDEIVRGIGGIAALVGAIGQVLRAIKVVGFGLAAFLLAPIELAERGFREIANLIPGITIDPRQTGIGNFIRELEESITATLPAIFEYKGMFADMDAFVAKWRAARVEVEVAAGETKRMRDEMAAVGLELELQLEKRRKAALEEAAATARRAKLVSIVAGTLLQSERIRAKIVLVNQAIIEGDGKINELVMARVRLEKDLTKALKTEAETLKDIGEVGKRAFSNMQDILAEFLSGAGGGFRNMARQFAQMLRDMVAQLLAKKILLSFLGAFGAPATTAASAAGFVGPPASRAHGGPLAAGQLALVGERGPELFIPRAPGVVVPSSKLGGDINITYHTTVNGADPARTREILTPLFEQNREQTKAELFELRARGKF